MPRGWRGPGTGLRNTGLRNTGLRNTGLRNTGLRNTGLRNTGPHSPAAPARTGVSAPLSSAGSGPPVARGPRRAGGCRASSRCRDHSRQPFWREELCSAPALPELSLFPFDWASDG
ncbi:pentapeptide repeat-containing protein [Deinococcus frigens]|uniref:pentapeptide repeat-containing protein n=1 Tax=Deinococcus frigens TaxID=249403 RepID=UPI000A0452D1